MRHAHFNVHDALKNVQRYFTEEIFGFLWDTESKNITDNGYFFNKTGVTL